MMQSKGITEFLVTASQRPSILGSKLVAPLPGGITREVTVVEEKHHVVAYTLNYCEWEVVKLTLIA